MRPNNSRKRVAIIGVFTSITLMVIISEIRTPQDDVEIEFLVNNSAENKERDKLKDKSSLNPFRLSNQVAEEHVDIKAQNANKQEQIADTYEVEDDVEVNKSAPNATGYEVKHQPRNLIDILPKNSFVHQFPDVPVLPPDKRIHFSYFDFDSKSGKYYTQVINSLAGRMLEEQNTILEFAVCSSSVCFAEMKVHDSSKQFGRHIQKMFLEKVSATTAAPYPYATHSEQYEEAYGVTGLSTVIFGFKQK